MFLKIRMCRLRKRTAHIFSAAQKKPKDGSFCPSLCSVQIPSFVSTLEKIHSNRVKNMGRIWEGYGREILDIVVVGGKWEGIN